MSICPILFIRLGNAQTLSILWMSLSLFPMCRASDEDGFSVSHYLTIKWWSLETFCNFSNFLFLFPVRLLFCFLALVCAASFPNCNLLSGKRHCICPERHVRQDNLLFVLLPSHRRSLSKLKRAAVWRVPRVRPEDSRETTLLSLRKCQIVAPIVFNTTKFLLLRSSHPRVSNWEGT